MESFPNFQIVYSEIFSMTGWKSAFLRSRQQFHAYSTRLKNSIEPDGVENYRERSKQIIPF